LHQVDILFPHINGDTRSKSHQIYAEVWGCLETFIHTHDLL